VTTSDYVMVLTKITKVVGAYHAFCSSLEVKKQVWVVLYAHHLQIITSLRNYVKDMPRRNIIYVQWIVHMNLSEDG